MAEKKKKAPVRKKKVPPPPKRWRWRFAKILLVLACFALVGAIWLVEFLESEAQRVGIFPTGQVSDVEHAVPAEHVREPASPSEDITLEEKQQLDAILQSRRQKGG